MNITERVVAKLTSGRWLMTASACAVFIVLAVTGRISASEAIAIMGPIFGFYFGQGKGEVRNG